MKRLLGKISVLALVALIGIQVKATAQELAPKDRNRVPALLLTDPVSGKTDRWESDGSGAAKVSIVGSSTVTANQGTSGSDTDPWNMMIRNGSGAELGLASSPFAISIFDAASNLLGVTANPFVVDLGVNNDVTVTSGTVTANIGTTGGIALETTLGLMSAKLPAVLTGSGNLKISIQESTATVAISAASLPLPALASTSTLQTTGNTSLGNIDTSTATTAGDTTSLDAKIPAQGQALMAASMPVAIASDQSAIPVTGTFALSGDLSDLDSGGGTDDHDTVAIGLPGAGGHVIGGTATDPFRTDPTGTTTQPVSGTVTSNIGTTGGLNLESTQTAMSAKLPAALTGSGNFKVSLAESTVTQTVSGTVTANAGTGTFPMQATAGAPGSVRLSDGTSFYDSTKTGQLPAALSGSGNLKTAILEDLALVSTADTVGAVIASNSILDGTTLVTPKFTPINVSSSGNNTILAAVVGKKIRVLDVILIAGAGVDVRFESGAGGTSLTGIMPLTTNSGFAPGFSPVGHFETAVNTLLNLELSAAQSVDGWIVTAEIN